MNSDSIDNPSIQKHSRVGILAFAIAEALFLFVILAVVFDAVSGFENLSEDARQTASVLARWFYFLLPLSCVLSIVGMSSRFHRKLFGAMALGTNVFTLIIILSLFFLFD